MAEQVTATPSPRVEPDPDLVAQANAIIAQECGIAGVPVQMAALRIIALAQDAKLREVAEWCEEEANAMVKKGLKETDICNQWAMSGAAQAHAITAQRLRAMMVKP